jgi:protein-S-isoprenylcysteine O-methyltransferase Ste14
LVSVSAPSTDRRRLVETGLDLGEKAFVIGLFLWLAVRMFRAVGLGASPLNYLQLIAEGMVVVLILLRRPARDLSLNPLHWALAVGATAGPLLIRPAAHTAPLGPPLIAAVLMIGGVVFQIWAKATLRLSFGVAPANRGVVSVGPYRLMRHPIYAAYLVSQVGFLLLNPTLWNLSLYLVSLGLQMLRIQAEEQLLMRDAAYAAYAGQARFRLLPGVW